VLLSALKSPEVRDPLLKQGAIIVGGTPDAYPAYYAKESAKWGEIIRSRGISMK
jgi:hypothetical protein